MNDNTDLPAQPGPPRLSKQSLVALGAGLLMGQVVSGIAAHHQASLTGLVLALVYMASASASLVMFLYSWPGAPVAAGPQRLPRAYAWLGMQGVGVLVSLQAYQLLPG
jgi:hypothetical protein